MRGGRGERGVRNEGKTGILRIMRRKTIDESEEGNERVGGGRGERRVRNGREIKDGEKRKQWMKAKGKMKERVGWEG